MFLIWGIHSYAAADSLAAMVSATSEDAVQPL